MKEKLELIARYDFGAYSIPGGFAIADPLDDSDGYFISGTDLESLLDETIKHHGLYEESFG